jgi:hypothetical protein
LAKVAPASAALPNPTSSANRSSSGSKDSDTDGGRRGLFRRPFRHFNNQLLRFIVSSLSPVTSTQNAICSQTLPKYFQRGRRQPSRPAHNAVYAGNHFHGFGIVTLFWGMPELSLAVIESLTQQVAADGSRRMLVDDKLAKPLGNLE